MNKRLISYGLVGALGVFLSACADLPTAKNAYKNGDYCAAAKNWGPLAEKGYLDAQLGLARLYQKGQCVKQSDATTLKYLLAAEKNGYQGAYPLMGKCYEQGKDVQHNGEKADYYYALAAAKGDMNALLARIRLYQKRELVPQSDVKLLNLLLEAQE